MPRKAKSKKITSSSLKKTKLNRFQVIFKWFAGMMGVLVFAFFVGLQLDWAAIRAFMEEPDDSTDAQIMAVADPSIVPCSGVTAQINSSQCKDIEFIPLQKISGGPACTSSTFVRDTIDGRGGRKNRIIEGMHSCTPGLMNQKYPVVVVNGKEVAIPKKGNLKVGNTTISGDKKKGGGGWTGKINALSKLGSYKVVWKKYSGIESKGACYPTETRYVFADASSGNYYFNCSPKTGEAVKLDEASGDNAKVCFNNTSSQGRPYTLKVCCVAGKTIQDGVCK